jgi:hypothetical protein
VRNLQQIWQHLGEPAFRRVLLLCLLVFVFSAKGNLEVVDTSYSLATAQAIVHHGRLDIPDGGVYTLKAANGKNYSKYGIGLSLYLIPWVVTGDVISRLAHLPVGAVTGFLLSFANIPFALLSLLLFARLLQLLEVTGVSAWLLPLALGLGSMAWRYAVYDFSEEIQMCLLLLALWGVLRGTSKAIVAAGTGFAALFLVKLLYVAFLPLFLCYLLTRAGNLRARIRRSALFTLPFVIAACAVGWLNVVRFGNAFESGYGNEALRFFPSQLWRTVPLLLGSLDKGLFIFCPILILGLLGWKEFIQINRAEAVLFAALIVGNLILTGAWHSWEGGWSWGPRFLVPLIPLWLLPAAFWLDRRPSRSKYGIFALLLVISILGQIPGILVKDNEIHVVKAEMLTSQERPSAPSDYVTAWILFWHKLEGRSEVYRASDFDIPGDRELDLTRHSTFSGLNIWTQQVGSRMKMPALRWLPLAGLFLLGYLAIQVGLAFRAATKLTISEAVRT